MKGERMEMSNEQRAERAFRAIGTYRKDEGWPTNSDEWAEVMRDLICDLHHLGDEYSVDMEQAIRMGKWHHREEVAEASPTCIHCREPIDLTPMGWMHEGDLAYCAHANEEVGNEMLRAEPVGGETNGRV